MLGRDALDGKRDDLLRLALGIATGALPHLPKPVGGVGVRLFLEAPDHALSLLRHRLSILGQSRPVLRLTDLFRERSAQFLRDDHSIVRWEADTTVGGELEGTAARVLNYLIAVPGTGRRTALLFTTTIPYPTEEDDGFRDEFIDELCLLSDTIVSTFAWESTEQ